jgi:PilZ domain
MAPVDKEQRRSPRVKFTRTDKLLVRYKFLSHSEDYQSDGIFDGAVINLSKGGALYIGPVPGPEWLPALGQGRVLLGINVMVPEDRPIKALASLRWTRPAKAPAGMPGPVYELGVRFEQVEPEHRSRLAKFLIGHQLRTRKFRRAELEQEGY